MYLRWAERQGFQAEVVEFTEGEETGFQAQNSAKNLEVF